MTSGPLGRCGPIRQCAYLVTDLEAAVEWWTALGVGPFLAMPEARMRATGCAANRSNPC